MNVPQDLSRSSLKPKSLTISARQRTLLHQLLHRKLRKCTTASLDTFQRLGWISGLSGGYELTEKGRALAEFSEQTITDGKLEISLP
jgi:hypothetical protein